MADVADQAPGQLVAAPAARSRTPWVAIAGGVTALLALPVVIAGCFLPYVTWTDTSNGANSSIFAPGTPAAYWFAVEPVAVVVFAIAAAILLIVLKHPLARAVAAGLLAGFGLQTITLFAGYTFGEIGLGRIGPGGPVGLIGGAILFAGGALGLGSLFLRD